MAPVEKTPTLEEVPLDKLTELSERHTDVCVYMSRFNDKSKIQSLKSVMRPLRDFLTNDFRDWLEQVYGGGAFIIDLRDVNNHAERLCTRFYINIQGAPKYPAAAQIGLVAGGEFAPPPSMVDIHSAWRGATSLPSAAPAVQPRDMASYTSDAIALQQAHELREELKQRERKHQQTVDRLTQSLDQLRTQMAQQERDHQRERQTERDAAREREMLALRDELRRPQPKQSVDVAALLVGLAPVLIAVIQNAKDKQQLQLDAQHKADERHTNMLMTFMAKKPEDGNKPIFDLITTLLPQLLAARSQPDKMLDMISEAAATNMQTLHMAAQAIRELAPPEETPGMQMIHTIIQGIESFAAARSTPQTAMPMQQQPRQIQAQQQQHPQQVAQPSQPPPAQVVAVAPVDAVPVQQPAQSGRQPRVPRKDSEIAAALVADSDWPSSMKSAGWVRFLTTLHSTQAPEEIAEELGGMLSGFAAIFELPEFFTPIFDEENPAVPSTLLRQFFADLPISQDPQRAEAILAAIDNFFTDDSDEESAPANGAAQAEIAEVYEEATRADA